MRSPRLLGEGSAYYHCVSRVVDRHLLFHSQEKEVFRSILRRLESFTGVRICAYCLMGNHFHLLLEVPDKTTQAPFDSAQLLAALPLLYDKATVETLAREIEAAQKAGNATWEREILERFERRRGDLSIFLKELKQRVSIFMNHRLGRTGTLWEGRFKSLLVEGSETALLSVAAYIDLNPVRAGLVSRPEDYRWSSFGEASGTGPGAALARQGLGALQRESVGIDRATRWKRVRDRYRLLLYPGGVEDRENEAWGDVSRRGLARDVANRVNERKTPMELPQVLRRKVRYFSDGAVLGTKAFVERVFERMRARSRISAGRKSGARRLRGADWGNLRVLRDLQVRVIGPPTG